MKLHEVKRDFEEVIQATAQALGIRDVFVEKDYWVTFALKRLANSAYQSKVVFKGGTSLSKAYKVINRFSEDIDLALLRKRDLTGNQIKRHLKKIEEIIVSSPFVKDKDFSKGSRFRKTGHRYPTVGKGEYGHASDILVLEINSFTNSCTTNKKSIESYISEFLKKESPKSIKEYELDSFDVIVLDIARTFTEKLLSLARVSCRDGEDFQGLRGKVRHFYDIHKMMKLPEITKFLKGDAFKKTLELALKDDLQDPTSKKIGSKEQKFVK